MRVDHAVSSGTFSLDGETFDVDNNIWVVGDDDECVVIDAPHSVDDILAVVGGRRVKAILLTHAHDDHCRVAPALREAVVAPILLHPDDKPLWELTHGGPETGDYLWDLDLPDGGSCPSPAPRSARCTPRATPPVRCCFLSRTWAASSPATPSSRAAPARPGARSATGRTLEASIRAKLFALPDDTVVHTGHGDDTTIGAEAAASEGWKH